MKRVDEALDANDRERFITLSAMLNDMKISKRLMTPSFLMESFTDLLRRYITMNWTAKDMDTYLQQKEYIDTLIVPLLKVETAPGDMKNSHHPQNS